MAITKASYHHLTRAGWIETKTSDRPTGTFETLRRDYEPNGWAAPRPNILYSRVWMDPHVSQDEIEDLEAVFPPPESMISARVAEIGWER
jgi:hypothetical protein